MKKRSQLEVLTSFIRLFRCIPENDLLDKTNVDCESLLDYGIVFPEIVDDSKESIQLKLDIIESVKQTIPEAASFNKTFYKTFNDVKSKSQEELYRNAIIHYFSTYGLESLGLEEKGKFTVPNQHPEFQTLSNFIVLKEISVDDALNKIKEIFDIQTGLTETTIIDISTILDYYDVKLKDLEIDINNIKNRQLRIKLFNTYKQIPDNGQDILDLIVYMFVNETTYVKNDYLYSRIKNSYHSLSVDDDFWISTTLAENVNKIVPIYKTNKKLLLSIKSPLGPIGRRAINIISRKSKELDKKVNRHNFLSSRISTGEVSSDDIEWSNYSIFDMIKIYNKLSYLVNSSTGYDVYQIRNGKFYLGESKIQDKVDLIHTNIELNKIKDEIRKRLGIFNIIKSNPNFDYALPTSEKTFIGNVPIYSILKFDKANVLGVSWKNKEKYRTDLDLSLITFDGKKYGWNSDYYNKEQNIIYSGDMTTEGAESFYFNSHETALVFLNAFNTTDVDYDLFFADEEKENWKENSQSTVNLKNIQYSTKLHLDKESCIGLFDGNNTFSFFNMSRGNALNVSSNSEINYLLTTIIKEKSESALKFSDVFTTTDFLSEEQIEEINQDEEHFKIHDLSEMTSSEILSLVNDRK